MIKVKSLLEKLFGKKQARDGEIAAAIVAALEMYADGAVHDYESYVITIRRK